jgi:hypothetical protein
MMLTSLVFFVINFREVNIGNLSENFDRDFRDFFLPFSYIFASKVLRKCVNENFRFNTNTTSVLA